MISSPNAHPPADRDRVEQAARGALADFPEGVQEFRLFLLPGEIEEGAGGWIIPVGTSAQAVNSYRLNNALDHLQEQIERRLQQPVIVIMDHSTGD